MFIVGNFVAASCIQVWWAPLLLLVYYFCGTSTVVCPSSISISTQRRITSRLVFFKDGFCLVVIIEYFWSVCNYHWLWCSIHDLWRCVGRLSPRLWHRQLWSAQWLWSGIGSSPGLRSQHQHDDTYRCNPRVSSLIKFTNLDDISSLDRAVCYQLQS